MNKEKMKTFIKEQRKKMGLTQEQLAEQLITNYPMISAWEKGKTIPSIDYIERMADIFGVTMDEVLEGELATNLDYSEKYFLSKKHWYMDRQEENTYELRQEQIMLINERFEYLLTQLAKQSISRNEEKEFKFLFENFYILNNDSIENPVEGNTYILFKNEINSRLAKCKNGTTKEKLWKLWQLIKPSNEINYSFWDLADIKEGNNLDTRFQRLNPWEKDILLACVQAENPVSSKFYNNAFALQRYKNIHGIDFDEERLSKDVIKYMINNGAQINYQYINYVKRTRNRRRIIDRIEELYCLMEKPFIYTFGMEDGSKPRFIAENNKKNRFIFRYYHGIRASFDYPIDKLYKMVLENREPTDEMLLKTVNGRIQNDIKEEQYLIVDARNVCQYSIEKWKQFRDEEENIEKTSTELDSLIEKLKKGERLYEVITEEEVGGKTANEVQDWCHYWNTLIDWKEFGKLRSKELTDQLMREIDNLSMKEIREKYFAKEVCSND